jgi:hypothetical protein
MNATVCRLKKSLGAVEACPGGLCPFWDDGSCAFEHVDFCSRPEFAGFLLDLRRELESVRAAESASLTRHHFFERLNAGRSD